MSWETTDDEINTGGKFYKLQAGDNLLRLASEPTIRHIHWIENKGEDCLGELCPHCKGGDKATTRFGFTVIDRVDGAVRLAEFGKSIASQLRTFQKEGEYAFEGPIAPYDVTIRREGAGMDTSYIVIPARKNKPITEEESAALIAFAEQNS